MHEWDELKTLFFKILKDYLIIDVKENKNRIVNFIMDNINVKENIISNNTNKALEYNFVFKICGCFNEILQSVATLNDVAIYINSFPFKNKSLRKTRFLRYNIECYFNEIYLFKERLIIFLNVLQKEYRMDKRYKSIKDIINNLYQLINTIKPFIETRGKHVHRNRLIDSQLLRLELFEGLIIFPNNDTEDDIVTKYYNIIYKEIKKKWKDNIVIFNKLLILILDHYSYKIMEILFDKETGQLMFPQY